MLGLLAKEEVVGVFGSLSSMGDADLAFELKLNSEEYGVGFRKDSDITAEFNKFMAKLIEDGTLQQLADKYGLTLAG